MTGDTKKMISGYVADVRDRGSNTECTGSERILPLRTSMSLPKTKDDSNAIRKIAQTSRRDATSILSPVINWTFMESPFPAF